VRCGRATRGSGSGVGTARSRQGLHCCSARARFRGAQGALAARLLRWMRCRRSQHPHSPRAALPGSCARAICMSCLSACFPTSQRDGASDGGLVVCVAPYSQSRTRATAAWRRARRPAPAPYPNGSPAARGAGLPVLPESYVVLIHTFVAAGQVARAESVYESMQRQDYDIRPGWLMLTCELFRNGCGAPVGRALLASQISASGKGTWRPQRRRRADRMCLAEIVSRRRSACRAAHVRITSHQAACRTAVRSRVTPSRRPCTMSISSLASASPCPPPGVPAQLARPA